MRIYEKTFTVPLIDAFDKWPDEDFFNTLRPEHKFTLTCYLAELTDIGTNRVYTEVEDLLFDFSECPPLTDAQRFAAEEYALYLLDRWLES